MPVSSLSFTLSQYYERLYGCTLQRGSTVSDGPAVKRFGNGKVLGPFRQIVVIEPKMIILRILIQISRQDEIMIAGLHGYT